MRRSPVAGAAITVALSMFAALPLPARAATVNPQVQQSPARSNAGLIETFAGGGLGDGGPATKAMLNGPPEVFSQVPPKLRNINVDAAGNVLVVSGQPSYYYRFSTLDAGFDNVRRIDAASGVITTVVGIATSGFSGDGGPANAAQLAIPSDAVPDAAGNLYILDIANQRVRRVDAHTGIITTVVGGSKGNLPGFAGDGGPAIDAQLALYSDTIYTAAGLAVNQHGDLFIGDQGNQRVRKVDGRTGIITTIAGTGSYTTCCPGDLGGAGDGGPATSAPLSGPSTLALDAAGNLYIGDGGRVRRVDAETGIITTVAGGGSPPDGLGDGGLATAASLSPACVEIDPGGNLVICDANSARVRSVDGTTGIITTIAGGGSPADGVGDGGPATAAALNQIAAVGFDAARNLYIADNGSVERVRKVDAVTGIITTIAGGDNNGDGGPATSARLSYPEGVATHGNDTYIADSVGGRVRKVDARGIITTVAGGGGSGDGGPATAAALAYPLAVALDHGGNLFIADGPVRRVDAATGIITTFAGGGNPADGLGDGGLATQANVNAYGVFVVQPGNQKWPAGTVFIVERTRTRMVDANTGIITTVAGGGSPADGVGDGGPATGASIPCAGDVVADPAGNLFVSDPCHSRLRLVDAATGIITTVAGNGNPGLAGLGGPALQANVSPVDLALDPAGNLYMTDDYHRVLKLDPTGTLSLAAGTGVPGFSGDGGPAVDASFLSQEHLALDSSGGLLIGTGADHRVRLIHPGVAAPPAGCGEVITRSTTLKKDLGPCPGTGIIVGADNITLNLDGHRVFGNGQSAGILVANRKNVTVTGGQVDHFSAGVVFVHTSGSTISDMTVRDNVGSYDLIAYSDGVLLFYSSHNRVVDNHISGNGIYDNVAFLGHFTDYNTFQDNTVTDSVGLDEGNMLAIGINVSYNAFADFSLPDRGASLVGNRIIGNTVLRAYANGLSSRSNTHALIMDNTSNGNGVVDHGNGVGIGLLNGFASTPEFDSQVIGNTVRDNTAVGLQIGGLGSRITDNTALGNGLDIAGDPPPCPNVWSGNTYGTTNTDCAANNGHQVPGTHATASATPQRATPPNPRLLPRPPDGSFHRGRQEPTK